MTYYYRKTHRYFGVVIGVQFLFWTLGGIFFSWSNMEQIHGDTNRKPVGLIKDISNWKSPSEIISDSLSEIKVDSIISLKTINILGVPFYQLKYFDNETKKTCLLNAKTGKLKLPLEKDEAIQVAKETFTPESEIKSIEYITSENINNHHEYRGRPLPAFVVAFAHKSGTRVYVSTEFGQVITFRNNNWRIFDFFWMMHTMDFKSRDNIGNLVLRIFSILGLITIISGFLLYYKTSKTQKKLNNKLRNR